MSRPLLVERKKKHSEEPDKTLGLKFAVVAE